jgi:hypothetical protein
MTRETKDKKKQIPIKCKNCIFLFDFICELRERQPVSSCKGLKEEYDKLYASWKSGKISSKEFYDKCLFLLF